MSFLHATIPRSIVTDSTHPPWLEQLHQVLGRIQLPVQDIVLASQTLYIDLAIHTGSTITAVVRDRREGDHGFAETRRFLIGYEGRRELDPAEHHAFQRLVKVLWRIEERLPALDGAGGVFVSDATPQHRFLRLYPFCTVERSHAGSGQITEVLVRTTSRCNQRCPFCTAPEHETPSRAVMTGLLHVVSKAFPGAMLSLTGGEPTLRPSFLEEVSLALSLSGIGSVQVQTNAVAFASKQDPRVLAPCSRLSFFVSLHALDESIYDRCTGTQGQFPLALTGLRCLADAGHRVTINCVINSLNLDHLPQFVREIPTHFPLSPHLDLHFSTLICPESKPEAEAFLVPYPAVARQLRAVCSIAREVGIPLQSLRASTHAVMPPCMLDAKERSRDPHQFEVLKHETGALQDGRPWVRAEGCQSCTQLRWCLGVPRPYALRFGLDDLLPIRES